MKPGIMQTLHLLLLFALSLVSHRFHVHAFIIGSNWVGRQNNVRALGVLRASLDPDDTRMGIGRRAALRQTFFGSMTGIVAIEGLLGGALPQAEITFRNPHEKQLLAPAAHNNLVGIEPIWQRLPDLKKGQKRIVLCRHGETELNRLKMVQGKRRDPPLNQEGFRQAGRLALALRGCPDNVQVVASSTMTRAQQTADVIRDAFYSKSMRRSLAEFDEIDYGAITTELKLEEANPCITNTYAAWANGDKNAKMEGGESALEIEARLDHGIQALLETSTNDVLIAVMHSSLLKFALSYKLNMSMEEVRAIGQNNCCINVIDIDLLTGACTCACMNEHSHNANQDVCVLNTTRQLHAQLWIWTANPKLFMSITKSTWLLELLSHINFVFVSISIYSCEVFYSISDFREGIEIDLDYREKMEMHPV